MAWGFREEAPWPQGHGGCTRATCAPPRPAKGHETYISAFHHQELVCGHRGPALSPHTSRAACLAPGPRFSGPVAPRKPQSSLEEKTRRGVRYGPQSSEFRPGYLWPSTPRSTAPLPGNKARPSLLPAPLKQRRKNKLFFKVASNDLYCPLASFPAPKTPNWQHKNHGLF